MTVAETKTPSGWLSSIPILIDKIQAHKTYWILRDILAPLAIVRLALIVVAWFSKYFATWPAYSRIELAKRGWHFSPILLLDMWARWDTGWYLSIIREGYQAGDYATSYSNIAFFPLYPYLVKFLMALVPPSLRTSGVYLSAGILLSNLFFVIALILLYKLVLDLFHDQGIAQRTIWYTLLFPTSFFFSCFYSESTFLLFLVGTFYAALKERWAIASLLGCLLALTRPLGILIIIPLGWIYLEKHDWAPRKLRADILWFSIIPVGLLAFLLHTYSLTGDFLAPMHAQAAWGRGELKPHWQLILHPEGWQYIRHVTRVDHILTIGFILLSTLSLALLPSASYGIFSLLSIMIPLMTGSFQSQSRFLAVVFPVFIVLAILGKRRVIDQLVMVLLLSFQVLFMVAWMRFYWVA